MLKQRLITAAILIPLIVLCVLKASTEVVAIVFAVIIMAGAWEWGALLKLETGARILFVSVLVSIMLLGFVWVLGQQKMTWVVLASASLLWIILTIVVMSIQHRGELGSGLSRLQYVPLGFLLFIFAWLAALSLHSIEKLGPTLLLYVFGLVWLADAGAYFFGRQWGKHKLANNISPGKTWQGLYGAMAVGLIYAVVAAWYFDFVTTDYFIFVGLSIVVIVFSVFGDLFESLLKRRAGVKDSGHLLPGHGGVLDRIDSLLAALPIMAFGLLSIEMIK